jgi:hypothetical protein
MATIDLSAAGKRFWGTKKRKLILIEARDSVTINDGYWDGGSRSEYWIVQRDGKVLPVNYSKNPPQFGGTETIVPITEDMALVRGGTFRGEIAHLTVYVRSKKDWTF